MTQTETSDSECPTPQLQPCPMCNGPVKHWTDNGFHYGDKSYRPKIEDFRCDCGFVFYVRGDDITKEQAFEKYNTRQGLLSTAGEADVNADLDIIEKMILKTSTGSDIDEYQPEAYQALLRITSRRRALSQTQPALCEVKAEIKRCRELIEELDALGEKTSEETDRRVANLLGREILEAAFVRAMKRVRAFAVLEVLNGK